jgi:hypothetical protein
MKAIIFDINSGPRVEDIEDGLATLQDLVGGYIEAAPTKGDVTVFINEEGKLMGLPPNLEATFFWWGIAPFMKGHDVLSGTAVIVGPPDSDGNTTPVPDHILAVLEGDWMPGGDVS